MAQELASTVNIPSTDLAHTPFSAQQCSRDGKIHILLAASGSVATIKLPYIAENLGRHRDVSIRIIITNSAENFLMGQSPEQPPFETLRQITGVEAIYRDHDEWKNPWTRGVPILHIELRKWAHLLLVAPLSANTMAKMTMGFSDNLLLSVLRAWDTTGIVDSSFKKRKPLVLVAPAMNTAMWNHPITKKHLTILRDEWGQSDLNKEGWVSILYPTEKELACGDNGNGAMMDWKEIVRAVEQLFGIGKREACEAWGMLWLGTTLWQHLKGWRRAPSSASAIALLLRGFGMLDMPFLSHMLCIAHPAFGMTSSLPNLQQGLARCHCRGETDQCFAGESVLNTKMRMKGYKHLKECKQS